MENFCTNISVLKIMSIIMKVIDLLCYILPIIIIIIVMIDYFKAAMSKDNDAIKTVTSKSAKKVVSAIIVFLIPTAVSAIMELVNTGSGKSISDCFINSRNISFWDEDEDVEKELNTDLIELTPTIKDNYNDYTTSEGSKIGQKYKLTEDEIKFLSTVAICEQGTSGAWAELDLIANHFEMQKNYQKKTNLNSELVDYVVTSKWFACANKNVNYDVKSQYVTFKSSNFNEAAVDQVIETLVYGNRKLPYYINEHDCWDCNSSCPSNDKKCCHGSNATFKGDICELKNNSTSLTTLPAIKNRDNYKQDITIIKNVYNSSYVFYTFPCEKCDPFGYTIAAKSEYDRLNNNS